MPAFTNPFARPGKETGPEPDTWKASPHSRRKLRKMGSGGIVSPGKVLSKVERDQVKAERADSIIDPSQAEEQIQRQEKYDWSFTALKDRVWETLTAFFHRLGRSIDAHFAPNAAAYAGPMIRDRRRRVNLRSAIVVLISFLIVFGALYTMVEYLLSVARATACSVSTVYFPVTVTVTADSSNNSSSSLVSPASDSISTVDVSMTSTSTHTVTSYVTLGVPAARPPYVYTVDSNGTTHWINGVSPTGGGSIVTETTTTTVTPPTSTGLAALHATTLSVELMTLPTYTTTVYTFAGSEVTTTSTSTSTNFITYTLSHVSPGGTESRSAFPGIRSAGWNASTTPDSSPSSILTSSVMPESDTYTSVYYTSSGPPTTSTTTTFITTTISRRLILTISPSSSEASPENTDSSSSSTGGWPSTLSSISTTYNGTMVGPETVSTSSAAISMTTVPIPSPLSTLLTIHASTSFSAYSITSTRSLMSSMSTPSVTMASSSSTAGAMTESRSSMSTAGSGSSSLSSARSNSESSTSRVQITNTMSNSPSASSSSVSEASSETSQASRTLIGSSPSSTMTKRTSTSWAVVPASASSSSTIEGSLSSTNGAKTTHHIYTTLSGMSTESSPSNSASNTDSSSMNSSGAASSSTSSAASSSQTGTSQASTFTLTEHKPSHTHRRSTTTSTTSITVRLSGSSSVTTRPETAISTTRTENHASSYTASTSETGHSRATTSAASSSAVSSSTSSLRTVHTSVHNATTTATTGTSSNPFPASSATATPTGGCGEHGSFLVDFDNLPSFTPTNPNGTDITQAPPIPNPYRHLTWSDGYVYAPQPHEPYNPVSPPHLAVFLADGTGKRLGSSPGGNYSKPGEISDGPREAISAFWFDAYTAWFGCDNRGPDACTLVFSAYQWSPKATTEVLVDKTTTQIEPCHKSSGCDMRLIEFPATFRSLSGLQIQAFVGNEERMFFMDDLSLHWTNNTCAAVLLRQSSS